MQGKQALELPHDRRKGELMLISRRRLLTIPGSAALVTARKVAALPADKIEGIEHKGVLIHECGIEGERRRDDTVPAHPNGIQASKDRWLVIYATRSFRGFDDDRSIVYQLRAGALDGKIVKEGLLARIQADPIDGGRLYELHQLGHPVLFGVPRGARILGRPAPSANVFVAKWRRTTLTLDKDKDQLVHGAGNRAPSLQRQAVQWIQFRLSPSEDDIEIIQPVSLLRQKGYETGEAFCSAPVKTINQSFVQAVPYKRDGTEWVDCNHFDGAPVWPFLGTGRLACLRYAYNAELGRYEWIQTGTLFGGRDLPLIEASLAQMGNQWIIAARPSAAGLVWVRTEDPFAEMPPLTHRKDPATTSPRTAYVCADGVLRLFTGDRAVSPYRQARNPLYCWDIDPNNGFTPSVRRVIFDSVKAGLPIRQETPPMIDMCKLLPHAGGRFQWILHRVQVDADNHPRPQRSTPPINEKEKGVCGVYYAQVAYSESFPSRWEF
jgi:hypothetical protein